MPNYCKRSNIQTDMCTGSERKGVSAIHRSMCAKLPRHGVFHKYLDPMHIVILRQNWHSLSVGCKFILRNYMYTYLFLCVCECVRMREREREREMKERRRRKKRIKWISLLFFHLKYNNQMKKIKSLLLPIWYAPLHFVKPISIDIPLNIRCTYIRIYLSNYPLTQIFKPTQIKSEHTHTHTHTYLCKRN